MFKTIALVAAASAVKITKPAGKDVTARDIICKFAASK